jgi:hypothetical protein
VSVPFTIEEIDWRFYNFTAVLDFSMKNIYDTINFSPIEFNKLLLKNQIFSL